MPLFTVPAGAPAAAAPCSCRLQARDCAAVQPACRAGFSWRMQRRQCGKQQRWLPCVWRSLLRRRWRWWRCAALCVTAGKHGVRQGAACVMQATALHAAALTFPVPAVQTGRFPHSPSPTPTERLAAPLPCARRPFPPQVLGGRAVRGGGGSFPHHPQPRGWIPLRSAGARLGARPAPIFRRTAGRQAWGAAGWEAWPPLPCLRSRPLPAAKCRCRAGWAVGSSGMA